MWAYVGFLYSFVRLHNFTFDIPRSTVDNMPAMGDPTIFMAVVVLVPDHIDEHDTQSLALYDFLDYRTFHFIKTRSSDPFKFSSIAAPFSDHLAVGMLLGISSCMVFLLLLLRGQFSGVGDAILLTLSGLIGKAFVASGNSRLWLWYSLWLLSLLASFQWRTRTYFKVLLSSRGLFAVVSLLKKWWKGILASTACPGIS